MEDKRQLISNKRGILAKILTNFTYLDRRITKLISKINKNITIHYSPDLLTII